MWSSTSASRRRMLPIVAVAAVVLAVLVAAMYLYDHSRRDLIANGVRIDGLSVGGLQEQAARRKVQDQLIARVNQPITVRWGSQHWTLSGRRADVRVGAEHGRRGVGGESRRVDPDADAARANGRDGGPEHSLAVTYSHRAVLSLAADVRATVDPAPRDATVQPTRAGWPRSQPGGRGRLQQATRSEKSSRC